MRPIKGYVGTYASPQDPGTFSFQLNIEDGQLAAAELLYRQTNTKYSAWWNGLLATVTESDGAAGLALLDATSPETPVLDRVLNEKTTACYLTWHDGLLYAANYHDGHVLIYSAEGGKLRLMERLFFGEESGCHMVIFHGRWLLVPCLLLDKVQILDRENGFAVVGTLDFPRGTGPRHGVFTADHRRFYLVSETTNQLFTYSVDGADFTLEGIVPILPEGHTGRADTAAIRLSGDESTLYVSVRGANLITVFRLGDGLPQVIQHADSLGTDPWDILLVPNAPLLLTSNRKSDAVVCRRLELDGRIGPETGRVSIPQCVGLSLEA